MAKRQPKFNSELARKNGATWHETDNFCAVTVQRKGFDKLVYFARNGKSWVHKDFQK